MACSLACNPHSALKQTHCACMAAQSACALLASLKRRSSSIAQVSTRVASSSAYQKQLQQRMMAHASGSRSSAACRSISSSSSSIASSWPVAAPGRRVLCCSASSSVSERAAATSAAAAPPPLPPAPQRMLTLERALPGSAGAGALDAQLWASGAFAAGVYPDLPIATTWQGLSKALWRRATSLMPSGKEQLQQPGAARKPVEASAAASEGPVVATVGAQLRSRGELQARLIAAAAGTDDTNSSTTTPTPPSALLLLSGSHPARSLPGAGALLPADALSLLRDAGALRARGALPPSLELWGVANPVTERDASRAEAKVAAGATVLLTQPPLDWGAFERWLADAERRGVTRAARVLVGYPLLSGAGNAAFWFALAGAPATSAPARALVAEFARAEADAVGGGTAGAANVDARALAWNRALLRRLAALPEGLLGGLHVMPIGGAAKRLALALVESGELSAGVIGGGGGGGGG